MARKKPGPLDPIAPLDAPAPLPTPVAPVEPVGPLPPPEAKPKTVRKPRGQAAPAPAIEPTLPEPTLAPAPPPQPGGPLAGKVRSAKNAAGGPIEGAQSVIEPAPAPAPVAPTQPVEPLPPPPEKPKTVRKPRTPKAAASTVEAGPVDPGPLPPPPPEKPKTVRKPRAAKAPAGAAPVDPVGPLPPAPSAPAPRVPMGIEGPAPRLALPDLRPPRVPFTPPNIPAEPIPPGPIKLSPKPRGGAKAPPPPLPREGAIPIPAEPIIPPAPVAPPQTIPLVDEAALPLAEPLASVRPPQLQLPPPATESLGVRPPGATAGDARYPRVTPPSPTVPTPAEPPGLPGPARSIVSPPPNGAGRIDVTAPPKTGFRTVPQPPPTVTPPPSANPLLDAIAAQQPVQGGASLAAPSVPPPQPVPPSAPRKPLAYRAGEAVRATGQAAGGMLDGAAAGLLRYGPLGAAMIASNPDAFGHAVTHPVETAKAGFQGLQQIGRDIPSLPGNVGNIARGLTNQDPAVAEASRVGGLHAISSASGLNSLARGLENIGEGWGGHTPVGIGDLGRGDGGSADGDKALWRHGSTADVFKEAMRQANNRTDPTFQYNANPHPGPTPQEKAAQVSQVKNATAAYFDKARMDKWERDGRVGPMPAPYEIRPSLPPTQGPPTPAPQVGGASAEKPVSSMTAQIPPAPPSPMTTSAPPPPQSSEPPGPPESLMKDYSPLEGFSPKNVTFAFPSTAPKGTPSMRTVREIRGRNESRTGFYDDGTGKSQIIENIPREAWQDPLRWFNDKDALYRAKVDATLQTTKAAGQMDAAKAEGLRAQAALDQSKARVMSDPEAFYRAQVLGGSTPAEAGAAVDQLPQFRPIPPGAPVTPATAPAVLRQSFPQAAAVMQRITPDVNPGTAVSQLMDAGLFANGRIETPADDAAAQLIARIYPQAAIQSELQAQPQTSWIPGMSDRDVPQRQRARESLDAIFQALFAGQKVDAQMFAQPSF